MAKESKNMLSVRANIVGSVMPYFIAILGKPGAIIELPSGGTRVYRETFEFIKNDTRGMND
jgi:hypothetical protein